MAAKGTAHNVVKSVFMSLVFIAPTLSWVVIHKTIYQCYALY